ncbi:hypothetical protein IscW_ISCW019723, partial [Ixodes scapularis]
GTERRKAARTSPRITSARRPRAADTRRDRTGDSPTQLHPMGEREPVPFRGLHELV